MVSLPRCESFWGLRSTAHSATASLRACQSLGQAPSPYVETFSASVASVRRTQETWLSPNAWVFNSLKRGAGGSSPCAPALQQSESRLGQSGFFVHGETRPAGDQGPRCEAPDRARLSRAGLPVAQRSPGRWSARRPAARPRRRGPSHGFPPKRRWRWARGLAPEHQAAQGIHDALVSAAVAGHSLRPGKINHLVGLTEAANRDPVGKHVALQLSHGAHDAHGAVAALGKGRHGKGGGCATGKRHAHHLMIHHVVIAAVYAAAIGPLAQGFAHALLGGLVHQHRYGPAAVSMQQAGQRVGEIDFFRIVGTLRLRRPAVQAAPGASLRCVGLGKVPEAAEGGHAHAALAIR